MNVGDRAAGPGDREHAKLDSLLLTYPEVGATAGDRPPGYRHIAVERIGTGHARFQTAVG